MRSRFAEDALRDAYGRGVRQYLILGAGFDTLGLKLLQADAELLVVELDRAAMVEAKERALAAAKIALPWPRSVATDLGDARALTRALALFGDRRRWRSLQQAGMRQDYSWDRSAREYVKIYERAIWG